MDEKELIAKREVLRKALDNYENALELALSEPHSGGYNYDHLNTSLIQVQSARRVLWMD